MVWNRIAVRRGFAVVTLGVSLGLAAHAAADTMIVRASGPSAPSYSPGKKLADTGSLALKAGDVVTLLDAKGTRTLRGPGTFAVASAAKAAPASSVTLAALLDTKRVRRARTGAVRGSVGAATAKSVQRPNLWLVDIAQPGTLCVIAPTNLRLWRADGSKAGNVKISGDGASATVSFAAGETVAAWPDTLPVRDTIAYGLNDGTGTTDIRVALLETPPQGLENMASSLIARQCTAQLDLLVDTAAVTSMGE
jgi:hypothetical protein